MGKSEVSKILPNDTKIPNYRYVDKNIHETLERVS